MNVRNFVLVAVALGAASHACTLGAEPDAQMLIAGLAREPPATVAFTEVRFSSLLREPLIVRGELGYFGPGSLERRVTEPYREVTVLRADSVRIERDGEAVRSFALKRAPEFEGFLGAFTALLAGDAATLERDFAVTASGDEARWSLELTPSDERTRRRVRAIAIHGSRGEPRCLATLDVRGGGSVLMIGSQAAAPIAPDTSLDALLARCRTE
jgi:hypothetical protein